MKTETKLIRAIEAERVEHPESNYDVGYNNGLTMAKAIILKMDVAVSLVRCGKCKHWDPDSEYCQFWHGVRHPGHYCGEGEKK